ncbi:thiamine pyrophosphate-dependent enzyme [Micromonospora sp. NPDC049559]|uniref:thiamine pyrophosphate-dependent enzyme n=1 Tax=Micromonospora sp. NPDC049559 TaxID=3155923 RepID=UPI00342D610A
MTRQRTTGDALVEGLMAHGVDMVFGLPGVQAYALFDALAKVQDRITVIGARHEQTCGYMAYGYARSTGRPGVLAVVPGPGVLNASAAMLTGYGSSTPMVCIAGDIPSSALHRGLGHVHELPDQLATLRSFTKWAGAVTHPAHAPGVLSEAFWQATSGRPRPAAVSVPWDVMAQSAPVLEPAPREVVAPEIDPADLDEAVALLRSARNPMIMVGSGAQDASAAVAELAELLAAPVVSLRGGRGVVSAEHPSAMNSAEGFERWSDTDVLLAVGTRQELVWFRWPDRPKGLKTINLDIDPEQHARLQPTVGLTGDASDGVAALLERLRTDQPRPSRRAEFDAARQSVRDRLTASLQPHTEYLAAIRAVLPDDGFFVDEISQVGFASLVAFPVRNPRTFISSGSQATLGFGFPTALGVKAAHPSSPVVSITGDGGFLFAATELATAVQYNLDVVTIVFTNNAYGNVLADQQRLFNGRALAAELHNPDFVALARSFGADGHRAENPEQLRATLDKALGAGRPAVIEVPMPLDTDSSPWPFLLPPSRTAATTPNP